MIIIVTINNDDDNTNDNHDDSLIYRGRLKKHFMNLKKAKLRSHQLTNTILGQITLILGNELIIDLLYLTHDYFECYVMIIVFIILLICLKNHFFLVARKEDHQHGQIEYYGDVEKVIGVNN